MIQLKRKMVVGLGLLVSMASNADVAIAAKDYPAYCYEPSSLLGTAAKGWIPYVYFKLVKQTPEIRAYYGPPLSADWSSGVCQVTHFDPQTKQPIGVVNCSALHCTYNDCDAEIDEGKSNVLLVQQSAGDFVQVLQKEAPPIWLKWGVAPSEEPEHLRFEPLLFEGLEGEILSELRYINLYTSLGGEPIQVNLDDSSWSPEFIYKVIKTVEYEGSTYLQLQRFVALERDSISVNAGPAAGVFYLQHRDENGIVVATIASYSCGC